jgi:hypothetical protein
MKIAIPTDDGIMLSVTAKNPKGYLVLTVKGGEIINEELRWNKLSDMLTSENGFLHNLVDCSLIIVNVSSDDLREYLKSKQIEVITTMEVIITKIIMEYLNVTLLRESNTCCSP